MQDNNISKTKGQLKAYNDAIRIINDYTNLQVDYQRYQSSLPKAEQEYISSKVSLEEATNALKKKNRVIKNGVKKKEPKSTLN